MVNLCFLHKPFLFKDYNCGVIDDYLIVFKAGIFSTPTLNRIDMQIYAFQSISTEDFYGFGLE